MKTVASVIFPIYWSRQHGAYISLICAWIISGIVAGFTTTHAVAIFYLLSGLNFVELFTEKLFRKSRLSMNKRSWLWIYGLIIIVSGSILGAYSGLFPLITLLLVIASIVYLILFKYRLQKSIVAEWLIFLMISISAFCGSPVISWSILFPAILSMTLFFGSSIFTVKVRFQKIKTIYVLGYVVLSAILLLTYFDFNIFSILLTILLFLKSSPVLLFPVRYMKLSIRKIGMIESLFQLLLIADYFCFFKLIN